MRIWSVWTAPCYRLRQTVLSHSPKSLQAYHTTANLSIALSDSTDRHDQQLYLLDASRFFDLLIFSHIWTHIKGVTPFKEGGKYGILSSCELIKARRKQKRGMKTDRWPDIDVAHGIAKPRVQWSLYTHCIQTLCLRIGHCAISFHLGPMKWMDGVITGLGDPKRHIIYPSFKGTVPPNQKYIFFISIWRPGNENQQSIILHIIKL